MLVSASGMLPLFLTGALAVRIGSELDLSEAQLGIALTAFSLAGSVAALMGSGRLADRVGWSQATRISAVGASASLLVIGVLARTYPVLVAGLVLGGAVLAIATPAGNLVLLHEITGRRQGLAFGLKQTSSPLAVMFAGLAVPLIALRFGWRWAFILALAVPVGAAILTLGQRGATGSRRDRRAAASVRVASPELWAVVIGGSLSAMAVGALSGFFVLSAVDVGVPEGTAGIILAAASVAGLVVRVGGGWLADRQSSTGLDLVTALLLIGSVGFAMLASGRQILVVPGALLAFGAGWGWPGIMHFGVVRTHRHAAGAATAFVHVGMSLGGGLGPLLFGFVAESAGFGIAWSGATVMAIVGAAAILRADRRLVHRLSPVDPKEVVT